MESGINHFMAEHLPYVIGSVVVVAGLGLFVLGRQYNQILRKLESMDHPRDGYVRLEMCKETRDTCGKTNVDCSNKLLKAIERLEMKIERNAGMMFFLADILVEKEIITGRDLTGLRERLNRNWGEDRII